jgi:hypothetical protein
MDNIENKDCKKITAVEIHSDDLKKLLEDLGFTDLMSEEVEDYINIPQWRYEELLECEILIKTIKRCVPKLLSIDLQNITKILLGLDTPEETK